MELAVIVLAAGASRRLGRPKQLVTIAGETLLARAVRIALEALPSPVPSSVSSPVLVVLGAYAEEIAQAVDLTAAQIVLNPDWEQGIAASIRAGIRAAERSNASAALLLACDQPRLSAPHLQRLVEAHRRADGQAIVTSRYAGLAGIPAIFPASQFSALKSLEGDSGAKRLLRHPGCPMICIDFAGGEIDVDTEEDVARSV